MKGISMIRALMAGVAIAGVCTVAGQAAQSPARPAAKPAAAAPRTSSLRIAVRDQDGTSLSGVRLVLSGAATGEFVTAGAGTAVVPDLKDGEYRLRCEREGFVTLEKEFTVRGGAYSHIDVVLAPLPPPPPKPAPEPPPPAAVPPGGRPVTMSIVDFLDKNLIGREPLKESVVACNPLETVRLLQMREAVAPHVHEAADEIIYVVAGEGAVRMGEAATPLRPGSLVVVTNGTGHAFERAGKNPLIVVSTLVGARCDHPETPR
jgi:cupin domain/carboxypeptidase family protein